MASVTIPQEIGYVVGVIALSWFMVSECFARAIHKTFSNGYIYILT